MRKIRFSVDGRNVLCYNFSMSNYDDIVGLSEKFGVNAEYKSNDFYPVFRRRTEGKDLMLLADENTAVYAEAFAEGLRGKGREAFLCVIPEKEPVADEKTCAFVAERLKELPLGAGDRLEAEKMSELLNIYHGKGDLAPAESQTLNDILAALLKMMAKYDV